MKYLYIFITNSFLGLILFIYLFFSLNSSFPSLHNFGFLYLATIIYINFLGFIIYFLHLQINRFWIWRKFPIIKIITLTTTFTALSVVIINIFYNLTSIWYFNHNINSVPDFNLINLRLKFSILCFNLLLIYVLADYLIFSYKNYIYRKVNLIKEQKERSQLQFEMLQKQLSPHYLFNSLNTISSLLETSAETTENYIRKLVKTYQYILSISKKELVSLDQELKMIRAYQFQLDVRFGSNIIWEFAIDDHTTQKYLPPLSLQVLIENAVKHNVASKNNTLYIKISATNNILEVENNITTPIEASISHKIGLKNLQNRYNLLGNYNIKTIKNDHFKVQLPLIELL